jgi:hypothetical protein
MAMISTLDAETDKKQIRDYAEECLVAGKGQLRQVTGTAIHAMLDHVDRGDDWQPSPAFRAAVDAYVAMLETYGLVPVDVEAQCVNDEYRLAGTMDRRYRTTRNLVAPDGQIIPIGSVIVGDTKTGTALEYAAGSYVTQLAGYVDSVRYDVATDERTPFDPPSFHDWAIIVHVVAEEGRSDLYWVDVNAGREALALAESVRSWRARTNLVIPATPPLRVVPTVADVERPPEAATRPPAAAAVPEAAEVAEWLRGRLRVIVAAGPEAVAMLRRLWPEGVPGLKHNGHSAEALDLIERVCDEVEKAYSLPFGPPKPRTAEPRTDFAARWSKPNSATNPSSEADTDSLRQALQAHPRHALFVRWWEAARNGRGLDASIPNRYALMHALYEFGSIGDEWPDDHLSEMLDGTLRTLGYAGGIADLGWVVESDAPKIMAAAFAITCNDAILMYGDNGEPYVRTVTISCSVPARNRFRSTRLAIWYLAKSSACKSGNKHRLTMESRCIGITAIRVGCWLFRCKPNCAMMMRMTANGRFTFAAGISRLPMAKERQC